LAVQRLKMGFTETIHKVSVPCGVVSVRACVPTDLDAIDQASVIWLHGGPGGCHDLGYEALKPLAHTRPFYFYDQLGSYESPCEFNEELIKIPRFAEELECICQALQLEKVVLIGHSWGGSLAIEYSLFCPDRVSGLVLLGPLISTSRWIADANSLLSKLPLDAQHAIRSGEEDCVIDTNEYKAASELFYKRHVCRLDPWPQSFLDSIVKNNKQIYTAMWGSSEFSCSGTLINYERFSDLHKLKMPVLFLCGRYDEATPETLLEASKLVLLAKFYVFEESAHAAHIEEPDNFRKVVLEFLDTGQLLL
jgi:proline iminopeptidase